MDFSKIVTRLKRTGRMSALIVFLSVLYFINPFTTETTHAFFGDIVNFVGSLFDVDLADQIIGGALSGIAGFFFFLVSYLTVGASELLNISIDFSLNAQSFRLSGITDSWEIFRDLANLVFIFILLYVGATTVLQVKLSETKRMLSSLIIVALLINFSFFLTGFVIDVSNVSASFIYNQVAPITPSTSAATGATFYDPDNRHYLGETLMEKLKLPSITEFPKQNSTQLTNMQKAFASFLGAIMMLVAAFVFMAGFVLFLLRQVVLTLLLVISPIAFAAAILPKTRHHFSMWFGKLINNAFVAPVYILLIAVAILIADSAHAFLNPSNQLLGNALYYQENYSFSSFAGIFMYYALIAALLVAATSITQKMSSDIGGASTKWAGKLTGGAAATAGFVGRQTAGRGLQALSQSKWFQDKADSSFGWRQAMRLSNVGAKASYDARASKTVNKAVGATAGAVLGVGGVSADVGKASGAGGFRKTEEDAIKRRAQREADIAKSLGQDRELVGMAEANLDTEKKELARLQSIVPHRQKAAEHKEKIAEQREKIQEKEKELEDLKFERQENYLKSVDNRGKVRNLFTFRTKRTNPKIVNGARQEVRKTQSQKNIESLESLFKNQGSRETPQASTPSASTSQS